MDPLSDILSLLKPDSFGFRGLDAGGDWSFAFDAEEGFRCYAIEAGECWLEIESVAAPVRLGAGDVVLIPGVNACRLFSAAQAPPIDAMRFFLAVAPGETAVVNGGGDVCGVGGYFDFASPHGAMLLDVLPSVIHIRAEATRAALRDSIARLMRELREPQPGSALMAEHLVQTLLIEALRLHLAARSPHSVGWLFAMADARLYAAMAAMHAAPERRWTLAALARVAGMSRSSFAARFRGKVGEPVMDYLTRWRMMLAADRLAHAGASIAAVAPAVGYESESAFGAAFKRVIGCSPRRFVRTATA